MAITIQDAQYVRFLRGTPEAWAKLIKKDSNTLYFISEKNSLIGQLYLGDKLIAGSLEGVTLDNLVGITSEQLSQGDLLVYNQETKSWENKTISQIIAPIISIMKGATDAAAGTAGLTPIPTSNDVNHYLKGDGTWAEITMTEEEIQNVANKIDTALYWDNF